MRKPGQLITRSEQKEYGLSRKEARQLEKDERRFGKVLLGETTAMEREELKAEAKAEKVRRKEHEKYGNLDVVLSDAERARILSAEIKRLTGFGSNWRVETKGDTWAQLRDPAGDPIGTGGTIMAIGTLGLSLATHKARRGRENDKNLYIEVKPNGVVERSGAFWHEGTDYSYVPRG